MERKRDKWEEISSIYIMVWSFNEAKGDKVLPPYLLSFSFFFKIGNGENRIFLIIILFPTLPSHFSFLPFYIFFLHYKQTLRKVTFTSFLNPQATGLKFTLFFPKPSIRFSLFKSSRAKPSST